MASISMFQLTPSRLLPACRFISRVVSSTRNTPAYAPSNGTTAELKMLLDRGENVPLDDRIATRTPQRGRTAGGSVFPRDSGECGRIGDLVPEVHGGPFAMSSGDRHEARSRPRSGEPPVPRLAWTRVPQASAARMSAWRTPC